MLDYEYNELAEILYPNSKPIDFYLNKYPDRKVEGEVTRIAPSPTGYLHIGQLYQALVHRMLANKTNGIFYARLEDTDNKREVDKAGEIAYEMLCRFGLKPDEGYRGDASEIGDYGPYKQSDRLDIYHSFAHELIKRGRAFPCFCRASENKEEIIEKREAELSENSDISEKDPCRDLTLDEIKEKLDNGQPFALRLRSVGDSKKEHEVIDAIKGKKLVRENEKDDVLIKSNGIPVYSFAHVVDDTLMRTTTVIRGQEWYQSLPVHLELSKAFGFKPFKYAHTPNICVLDENGNKRKISKRKDTFADVRFFLKKGYPIEAVIEYLLNLLNSDFEIWRKNNPDLHYTEFPFDIKKIGVTNPLFDFMKLNDISKTIISRYSALDVYNFAINWARDWDKNAEVELVKNRDNLLKVFSIDRGNTRPRKDITYFSEILALYDYVLPNFKGEFDIDLGNVNKNDLIAFLNEYVDKYDLGVDNTEWFEKVKLIAFNHNFTDNKTYKLEPTKYSGNISDATKYLRLAITGKENSPELFSIMNIVGKDECIARIKNLINKLERV